MEGFEELKNNVRILLVDDDLDYIQVTAFFLKSKGYNVDVVTTGADAIEKVRDGNFQIVLLDFYMPGLSGEDVVNKIREFNNKIIIILQTGFAGQQPPEQTLARLAIQNYHDKSDGVDKLLLQIMSAVRVFAQQNKVILAEYRVSALGRFIKKIAEDLKSPLLGVGAGIEATKTLVSNINEKMNKEDCEKLDLLYNNNKEYLNKIDKTLSILIKQSDNISSDEALKASEIMEAIDVMTAGELYENNISLEKDIDVKLDSYIRGKLDDVIFITCELIHKMIDTMKSSISKKIFFTIKETSDAWYISLEYEDKSLLTKTETYLIRNIILGMEGISFEEVDQKYVLQIKK